MAQTSGEFLAGLRNALRFRMSRKGMTNRRRNRRPGESSHTCESLEQRQLLVQPPVSLLINSGTTSAPITVQWVQPSQSPAASFDVTVTRTGLVSGGDETVLLETAWPAASAPGVTETYTISEPLPAGSYSVSLVARGSDASVSTATTKTFVVTQLTPQLLRISGKPLVGANTTNAPVVSSAVSLSWTILPGVNSYYVWIGKKNTATPAAYPQIADPAPQSVQGGVYEGSLEPGDYRVWVRNLNGPTNAWSAPMDFSVVGTDSFVPAWNSTTTTMGQGAALSWNPVPSAVRYDVEITGAVSSTASVAGTEYRGGFLSAGTYSARVRGFDAMDQPLAWSTALPFTITSTSYQPQITSSPVAVPTNGVSSIIWNGIGWADAYEVTLQSSTATILFRERTKVANFAPPLLTAGTYNVTIKAYDTENASGVNQSVTTGNFQITTTTYKPATPTLTQGASGSLLTWPQISGAARYDVWIDRVAVGGFTAQAQLVREFRQDVTFRLDSRFDDGATYKVWVMPVFPDGKLGAWSNFTQFVVSTSAGVFIGVNAATGSSLPPQFTWPKISGAASYDLWVSKQDLNVAGTESGKYFPIVNVVDNRYVHHASLESGSYVFWYKARDSAGNLFGLWSVPIPFTVAAAASVSIPDTLNISLSKQSQTPVVEWNSTQAGLVDIRVVCVEQLQTEVLREQYFVASSSAIRNSYALRGGLAPGLYRVDVGPRSSPSSAPGWVSGPVFYFNGNRVSTMQALGALQTPATLDATGPFRGDFNGDGFQDLVKRTTTNGELTVSINESALLASSPWNSNGTTGFTDFVSGQSTASVLVGDFNGDGRDDLVQPDMASSVWLVMRSSTTGAFEKITTPVTGLLNPDLPTLAWNSQTKVLSWNAVSSPNSSALRTYELQVVRNGTASTYPSVVSTISRSANDNSVASFTEPPSVLADGEYTVFVRTGVNGRVSQWSEGFGITVTIGTPPANTSVWHNYVVGDFNGDRRDDIAAYNSIRQQWTVAISTGTSFEQTVWTSGFNFSSGSNDIYSRQWAIDVNGDGRKDIVTKDDSAAVWVANISTGTSFLSQTWATPAFLLQSDVSATSSIADLDADGKEDVVAWVGSSLRAVFSRENSFQDSAGGVTWPGVTTMPGNTALVDMNSDGRPDLAGFDANGKSIVALGRAVGFGTATVWEVNSTTPWVIMLQDSGVGPIVADYNYRTRSVYEAFNQVHNIIEFEGYRGIKKGADATLSTKSGNAWDQTNLLGALISTGVPVTSPVQHAPFTGIKYATGTMTLTAAQVQSWLTTTTIPMDYFLQAGLTPVTVSTGVVKIDHAWLQAWLPKATGMGWVDLNPSLKASIYTAPAASAAVFTANDLKEYLTPVDVSFSADFDAGGEVTQQDIAAIPQQIRFISGAGAPVTNNAWPKLSGNDDYKIATVRGATSNIAVGAESINGSISASILGIKDGNALLQSFRVYARATSGYELGFSIAPGVISKTSIQLYERQGTQSFNLTDRTDLSTFNSGAEEVSLTVNPNLLGEFPSVSLMNVAGFQAIHVKVKVENMTIMAWLQYRSGTDIKRYKLAASFNYANRPTGKPAGFLTKGRFGIVTDGDAQHFVDDISFQGEGYPTVSPLSWTIDRNVKSTDPVKRASVSNVGTTRTIRSTDLLTNAILNVSEVNPTQPSADQHQKVTLNLVGPVGSTTTTTVGIVKPQFAADLVRKTIIVRTSPDLKTGWLYMDGTLYETTTSTGVLHLESESQIQGAAAEAKQSFVLPADGVSEYRRSCFTVFGE